MKKTKVFYITLSISVTVCFVLLGIFTFHNSYFRLAESFADLWISVKFYFLEIFGIKHNITPTVNDYSKTIVWENFSILPEDFDVFSIKVKAFFCLLINIENFSDWGVTTAIKLGNFAKLIAIILPCIVLMFFAVKKLYENSNTKHNNNTLPLKLFKAASNLSYRPLKSFIQSYISFLREHSYIRILWIFIWVLHLNLATILIEFFAYYFYFAVSYSFPTIYTQFCKLFIDLQVIFSNFPMWSIGIIIWLLFDRFRRKIALSILRQFEARNCGFINELPIVSMTCASMGKKKTTAITDMALSQEVMFRQKAFEILQKNDMKFPNFPWICLEKELQKCMEFGKVFNLATVKEWIKKKQKRFEKHGNSSWQLYRYDYKRYGMEYDDGLKISALFEVLETYSLAYFIYVIESSLIVANYSVRTDNMLLDEGNFPMWYSDFFPKGHSIQNRHSHILDFDVLRLGKKVIDNNPKAGSFEFGVVVISEIGKERGNNLELKEVKKGTFDTNQKNDLFNAWLKMCRHSATVDNFPFIKVFTDEQRPESWGADARDLCDIVNISTSGDQQLALPFYTIEDIVSEWIFNKFIGLYYDLRFKRGDNTLLVHLLKGIASFAYKRNIRIYNRFGYSMLKIEKERGTMDGKVEKKTYYLMNKKIYSSRFSTDCFSDYFNEMAKKTKIGLNDYLEYATVKANINELKMQNSYFINGLYKDADEQSKE